MWENTALGPGTKLPYILSAGIGVVVVLKCLKKMANKNCQINPEPAPNFFSSHYVPGTQNQGFVRQNFVRANRAWIPEYNKLYTKRRCNRYITRRV